MKYWVEGEQRIWMLNHPNDLTVRLMAEGYTPLNTPPGVKWQDGEMVYTLDTIRARVYETPCGLLKKGGDMINGYSSAGGIDWRHENDNPLTCCPYIPSRKDCKLRDPRYPLFEYLPAQCALHLTDKPFDPDKSVEAVRVEQKNEDDQRRRTAFGELAKEAKQKNVGFCPMHANWLREKQTAVYFYDFEPYRCVGYCEHEKCMRCGIEDDHKRGNVLVDVHTWSKREDNTFLSGEITETVIKGVKLLDKPVRLAVCHMIVDQGSDWAKENILARPGYRDMYRVEVENLRILPSGKKDAHNLLEDLQAVQSGIAVVHDSDLIKAAKKAKDERKKAATLSKARKLAKKIASGEETIWEARRFEKYAEKNEELYELLDKAYNDQSGASETKVQQLSLFDAMDNNLQREGETDG